MKYFLVLAAIAAVTDGEASAFGRGGGAVRGGAPAARPNFNAAPRPSFNAAPRPQASSFSGSLVGPAGGVSTGGGYGNTYTGPKGSTIQTGHAGGSYAGPGGGGAAGGAAGIKVTTPNGQTYTHGKAGGVAVGPNGGVAAGGAQGTAASGPNGGFATGGRAGAAVGPNGGVAAGASRGGVAYGPNGAVAGRSGAGFAAGPYGNYAGGAYRGGVAVGANGAYAAGHSTRYYGASTLPAYGNTVRGYHYGYYNRGWYVAHPNAWVAARWTTAGIWAAASYASLATYCGCASTPVVYDYGSNVVINDNQVYVDGDSVGTASDYAAAAATLADTGRAAQPEAQQEWQPLGVFGLMQNEQETVAQRIFQLAIDKNGVIRGNYYDAVGDTTTPVYGSVDKKTQRAAWSIGDKKDVVFETGLDNFTKDQTSCLVHYGKDNTQQMLLVRLPDPDEKK